MKISVRNKLSVTVKEIVRGGVMAKVVMDHNGDELVSVITNDSVDELGLKPGDSAVALIKAVHMIIGKE